MYICICIYKYIYSGSWLLLAKVRLYNLIIKNYYYFIVSISVISFIIIYLMIK